MKLFKHTTRLFIAALIALPLAGFAAEEKALMQPVKSVLDHYLMIQTELAKDTIKGVDEHANAIAKAVRGDEMKMLSPCAWCPAWGWAWGWEWACAEAGRSVVGAGEVGSLIVHTA